MNITIRLILATLSTCLIHTSYATNDDAVLDPAAEWQADLREAKFVLVDTGGILAPIQTNAQELTLTSNQAFLSFHNGTMSGAINTPVSHQQIPAGAGYSMRPTLVVSIHGFQGLIEGHGDPENSTTNTWQAKVSTELTPYLNNSQFKHFMVNWHSDRSNRRQSLDVNDYIKNFLNNRAYDWDVVLIGHSRGGIFAHELSKHLLGQNKIHTIRTILLDPTAVPVMGDTYPHSLYSTSSTPNVGALYYDNECVEETTGACGPTNADRSISGYTGHIFAAPHSTYPNTWLTSSSGFEAEMSRVISAKHVYAADTFAHDFTQGGLDLDGSSSDEDKVDDLDRVITVHIDDIYVDGDIEINSDYIALWGEIGVGPVTAGTNLYMGENGIEGAANIAFLAASTAIREDYIGASASVGIASISTSLSEDGINTQYDFFGMGSLESEVSLDRVGFSSSIFGSDHATGASISLSGGKVELAGVKLVSW